MTNYEIDIIQRLAKITCLLVEHKELDSVLSLWEECKAALVSHDPKITSADIRACLYGILVVIERDYFSVDADYDFLVIVNDIDNMLGHFAHNETEDIFDKAYREVL